MAPQAKMSRTPGRRWSSIAVLTRTNAQLATVQEAMDSGPRAQPDRRRRPRTGIDLRGEPGRRGAATDDDEPSRAEDPAARDRVVLTTFHRAKGLQWPTVSSLGLSEGLMPIGSAQTPAAIDEERRLLYVALTRSEEELWCSWFERPATRRAPGPAGARARGWRRSSAPSPSSRRRRRPTAAAEVSARGGGAAAPAGRGRRGRRRQRGEAR